MADQTITGSDHIKPIQVQKFLGGVDYPASKPELMEKAKEEGAGDNVLQTLHSMLGDIFFSVKDVAEVIGKIE